MRIGIIMIAAGIVAVAHGGDPALAYPTRPELLQVLKDIDSGFVCPQFLASPNQREREIRQFAQALAEIDIGLDDARLIRRKILERHHCRRPARSWDAEADTILLEQS